MLQTTKIALYLACLLSIELCYKSYANSPTQLTHYDVNLTLTKSLLLKKKVPLQTTVTFTNTTHQTLSRIPLVVFSNYYSKPLPYVNDLNHRQLYSGKISAPTQHIEMCQVNGKACTPKRDDKKTTHVWIDLDQPLQPNETLQIELGMTLHIPEKFGSFGSYRRHITLSGGLSPYIPSLNTSGEFLDEASPPQATWTVHVAHDTPFFLEGVSYPLGEGTTTVQLEKTRSLGLKLFLAPSGHDCFAAHGTQVCLAYEHRTLKSDVSALKGLIQQWLDYIDASPYFSGSNAHIALIQAPLREVLVRNAEHVSYVSDRAFRVVDALKKFHLTPVVHALFYQLLYDRVSRKEADDTFELYLDSLAAFWTDTYLRSLEFNHRDARKLKIIQWFSFLPVIDAMVYSPQFAFSDVFFDSMYPFDSNRDDFWRFNHRKVPGRTFYERLKDRVGLSSKADDMYRDYTTSEATLADMTQVYFPGVKDLSLRELEAYPKSKDYRLLDIQKNASNPGHYTLRLDRVQKSKGDSVNEPVEILVTDRQGGKQALIWDDQASTTHLDVDVPQKIASVEVDPRFRLLDYDRSNNRDPAQYKTVLSEVYLNYDFNSQQPELFLLGQYRKLYGGQNRYNYRASYLGDSYGVGVGVVHLFGQFVDSLRLSHAVSMGLGFDHLSQDSAVAYPLGTPTLIQTSPSGFATSVNAGYFFGNQLSFINPMAGLNAGITGVLGTKYLGGDFDYYSVGVGGSWVYPVHPLHLLAFRAGLERVGGKNVPTPVLNRLGGSFNMRGLSLFEDQFRGKNMFIFSTEYRHFLWTDMDVNVGWFRLRDIQGALFTDLGSVSDTLSETVNDLAGVPHSNSTFIDLWDPRRFQHDVGYGLRLFVDYFGVGTQLLSFDFAQSTTNPETGVRFYFRVTQSF